MNFKKFKEIVFPYGNLWFYPLVLIWYPAIAIFYISFPALLSAAYIQVTGVELTHLASPLITLSADLLLLDLSLIRFTLLFIITSGIFDAVYEYDLLQRKRGYL